MTAIALPFRERPQAQSLILGGFTLLICIIVGLIAWSTRAAIHQRELEDTRNMLSQVFPSSLYDNAISEEEYTLTLDGQPVHYFLGRKQGQPSGIVLFASAQGYAGAIKLLLGISVQGELTGVRVIEHKETPGLGDGIDLARSPWILGFNGKSLQNTSAQQWHVKKDGGEFDAFTGATITPRGVVRGVYESLQLFQHNKAALLAAKKGE